MLDVRVSGRCGRSSIRSALDATRSSSRGEEPSARAASRPSPSPPPPSLPCSQSSSSSSSFG
eukprot:4119734-Prymnesium_polylepis.1